MELSSSNSLKKCLRRRERWKLSKSSWVEDSSGWPGVGQKESPLLNSWVCPAVSLCEDKFTINLLGYLCLSKAISGGVGRSTSLGASLKDSWLFEVTWSLRILVENAGLLA